MAGLEGLSDGRLLRLGTGGNEDAFVALYQRRHASLFRFAQHMCGDREMAAEAVQEVFLALLNNDAGYQEDRGTVEAYLIGMTRNQIRRQLRIRKKTDALEAGETAQQAPDDFFAKSEVVALRRAILGLPESYRAAIVLCELEELSYADAAQQLGCAVGTVRSRLHRARALLQAKLRRREECRMTTNG